MIIVIFSLVFIQIISMLKILMLMYNCFYKTIACYSVALAYYSVHVLNV